MAILGIIFVALMLAIFFGETEALELILNFFVILAIVILIILLFGMIL